MLSLRSVLEGGEPHLMKRHGGESHHKGGISNRFMAYLFWAMVAVVLSILVLRRLILLVRRNAANSKRWSALGSRSRLGPASRFERIGLALGRLAQRRWRWRGAFSWLSPPPMGKSLLLVFYLATCIVLSVYGILFTKLDYLDRTAIRTAWIALTQVPLLFLLSARGPNLISLVSGLSYERIHWAHQWVARVVTAIAIVHGACFTLEWANAGIFWSQWNTMKHTKYGAIAVLLLIWMGVSSVLPIRRWSYEVFLFHHRMSVVLFLVLLYWHLPSHHKSLCYVAMAVFAWNSVHSFASFFVVPVVRRYLSYRRGLCSLSRCHHPWQLTSEAALTAVGDEVTTVEIRGVHSRWSVGQHVLVWVPRFWWHTAHPFTIVNSCENSQSPGCRDIQLVMRTKTGFTRLINRLAAGPGAKPMIRVCVSEPFGQTPRLDNLETVVLASASTGASFTLPILEELVQGSMPSVRRINVLLVARDRQQVEPYIQRILRLKDQVIDNSLSITVEVAISGQKQTARIAALSDPLQSKEEDEEAEGLIGNGDKDSAEDDDDESLELDDLTESNALGGQNPGFAAKIAQRRNGKPVPSPIPTANLAPAGLTSGGLPSQTLTGRTLAPSEDFEREKGDILSPGTAKLSTPGRRQSRDETVYGSELDEEEKIGLEDNDDDDDDLAIGTFELHEETGRPNMNVFMDEVVSSAVGRIGVVACGGTEFTGALRMAHARVRGGRDVWFYAEEFGG